jgi:hypothetical protein
MDFRALARMMHNIAQALSNRGEIRMPAEMRRAGSPAWVTITKQHNRLSFNAFCNMPAA